MREWQVLNQDVVEWRFLRTPEDEFMRDLVDFRVEIEVRAARLAAERATDEDLARISDAMAIFEKHSIDDPEFMVVDENLHAAILAASNNRFFDQMAPIVRAALGLVTKAQQALPRMGDGVIEAHRRVVDAIVARDANGAEAAMRALLSHMCADVEYLIAHR